MSLDPHAASPLYVQLQRTLRSRIQSGEWQPGLRLPAVPALAQQFGVHRLTVLKALSHLKRTGWIETVTGRGSFVARHLPETAVSRLESIQDADFPFEGSPITAHEGMLGDWLGETLVKAQNPNLMSFSAGFPPPDLLPVEALKRLTSRTLRELGSKAWTYSAPGGYEPFLDVLRNWLNEVGESIPIGWGLRVLPGAQSGLALVLEALTVPGDTVIVESPCYVGMLALIRALGRVPLAVPVDRQGLDPSRLASALQRGEAKLLFTVPTFHNPTGMTLSRTRRERVVALTRLHGVPILEDVTYGDLRFTGKPLASLRRYEGAEHVIQVGSFSKSLAAGLRLGFLVAHEGMLRKLAPLQEAHIISVPTLSQATVAAFIQQEEYARHLARLRRALRSRRDAMLDSIDRHFPSGTIATEPKGGMHLWVMLPDGLSALDLHQKALHQGLGFAPGPLFFPDGRGANCLRLNFSTYPPRPTAEAIAQLGRLF